MTLKRNLAGITFLSLVVALATLGCNQEKQSDTASATGTTVAAKTTGDCCSDKDSGGCPECAEAALASAKADDCSDCPICSGTGTTAKCEGCDESTTVAAKLAKSKPAEGCCGKCGEEEKQAASKKSEGCGDCPACNDANAASCKCSDEAESVKKTSATNATDEESTESQTTAPKSDFARDREVFHFLLSNKDKINRQVTETSNGVETLTESSDPAIVEKIQEHVASMYQRVENVQPIRMRDPLYREIFKHTDKIEMKLENTDNGIRVVETSEDEYVVKLIQAHAKVVSGFVEHGFEEAHKNHEPPKK